MIILVDNESYAKRLAEVTKHSVYVTTNSKEWAGELRLLSDIGFTVVTTGKEVEEYLDENNIYYIHPAFKPKESFDTFLRRTNKMVDERKDLIEKSDTTEKLIYGITSDGSTATMYNTKVVFSVTQDLKTGEYYTRYKLPNCFVTARDKVDMLKMYETKAREHFGPTGFAVEEDDFYEPMNYSSGKTVPEILAKFHMFIAAVESSYTY